MQGTDALLLQRIADLEVENQMLEAFSGAVAHNLKGLLYHIAGYARTLRDVHAALPDADLYECLELMHNKARETLEIVDDLLFLSGAELEGESLATGKYGQVSEPTAAEEVGLYEYVG